MIKAWYYLIMKSIIYKDIPDLILDIKNPRFGELYTGSNKEDDLIEYLLFNESALSLADRFSTTKEFYIDKPLLVLDDHGKLIVKDGNRRCAAVKALVNPKKYGLKISPYNFKNLPVVIYTNKDELENRIMEEHTNSMFKEWDRIAKAIEVFRQFQSGSSIESMEDIDSKPVDLIKLASFYYEAVRIGKDSLKKLLRKGKGGTGGKTIIFERLFKYSNNFGYRFKNKPDYIIEITDKNKFNKYIKLLIKYLENNPSTSHGDVDKQDPILFKAIGISLGVSNSKKTSVSVKKNTPSNIGVHRNKFQKIPQYNRIIPAPLKKVIDECYSLDEVNFTNSKIAMSRVVFECCLKYIIEETDFNGKKLRDYHYFDDAFLDQKTGKKLKWTKFAKLKELFEELIINTGKKQAFKNFDLETPHQIIHNYNIAGLVKDSRTLTENLVPLVDFILESEASFIKSVDISKL